MESIIVSFFYRLFMSFFNLFKKTGTYKLFDSIYNAFSNAWKHSAIVNLFKRNADTDYIAKSSLIYKILNLIFTFLTFLRDSIGRWLARLMERSCFINVGRLYLNNALAVNTRFIGVMMIVTSITYNALKFILWHQVSKIAIIMTVIGFVFCIVNYNVTSFLKTSRFSKFVFDTLGFEVHFDFFKKSRTKGMGRLVLAALLGIVMGVVMTKSWLLALIIPVAIFGGCLVLYAPITVCLQ